MTRRRIGWLGLAISSLLLLACVGLGGSGGLPVDSQAPDFGIQQSNRAVTLSDLAGHVVVVNFWSTT